MRYLVNAKVWAIALALVALSGCGGGSKGADGTSGANGSNGQTALVNLEPLAVGSSSCANGGVNVQSGLDTNSNAKLEANEVQSTKPICNGANGVGVNGVAPSIRINTGAFDGNNGGLASSCTTGGTDIAITVGSDPAIHSYLCNGAQGAQGMQGIKGDKGDTGAPGSNGAPGTDGLSAVVSPISITGTAGGDNSKCAVTGGVSVKVGDSGTPSYVCNGTQVVLSAAPANACRYGGVQISISTSATPQTLCNGNLVQWVDVQSTSQQAAPNTGYLASSSSLTTITLPPTNAVNVGDVVKVTGVGAGGWKIVQNAGQQIYTGSLGNNGIVTKALQVSAPSANYYSIALSQEGSPIYAAAYDGLYKSPDGGLNWANLPNAPTSGGSQYFQTIAASSNGKNVVAAGNGIGIYISSDFGDSWSPTNAPVAYWAAIVSSTSGVNLVAADKGSRGVGSQGVYYSTDSGSTWTQATGISGQLTSLAGTPDAQRLFAVAQYGDIYTSIDYGANWTATATQPGTFKYSSVSTSVDGRRVMVTAADEGVYVSQDAGATWTKTSLPTVGWDASAMDANGKKLVAAGGPGAGIYTSDDYGSTWTKSIADPTLSYYALAVTVNGRYWYAANNVSGIARFSAVPYTTLGASGSISGKQYDTIELQYTGNDLFTILGSTSSAGLTVQ